MVTPSHAQPLCAPKVGNCNKLPHMFDCHIAQFIPVVILVKFTSLSLRVIPLCSSYCSLSLDHLLKYYLPQFKWNFSMAEHEFVPLYFVFLPFHFPRTSSSNWIAVIFVDFFNGDVTAQRLFGVRYLHSTGGGGAAKSLCYVRFEVSAVMFFRLLAPCRLAGRCQRSENYSLHLQL
jgi:hypothetical protein